MKKLLFIIAVFAFVGCNCIAQLPPQYIYVDSTCQAVLPDYTANVTVRDNCQVLGVSQSPEAGYILNAVDQTVDVTITALDNFGNESYMIFEVIAVDTIPPIIEPDSVLLNSYNIYQNNLIKQYHKTILADLERADEVHPDTTWLSDGTYITKEQTLAEDSTFTQTWYENNMVVVCPNGGEGWYQAVFYSPETQICTCDTATNEVIGYFEQF